MDRPPRTPPRRPAKAGGRRAAGDPAAEAAPAPPAFATPSPTAASAPLSRPPTRGPARNWRQLDAHSAGLLEADTTQANGNLSLLHIHDQRTAPGGLVRFKQVLSRIERRLDALPLFRQRLVRVAWGLDHPYWADDPHFDLEYHVRHIALPKPGDWRQFCIQVSRIHARPLDFDRPPWEVYVIEGLDSFLELAPGSFALMFKTHLAAVDLADLGELTTGWYDESPAAPDPGPAPPWMPQPAPGRVPRLRRGLSRSLSAPWQMATPLLQAAAQLVPAAASLAGDALRGPDAPTATRFNAAVSPHRVFESRRFDLGECEAIRAAAPGATLEDVVLATCGGALRQYLADEGELPALGSLSALLPRAGRLDADLRPVAEAAPPAAPSAGPGGDAASRWRHAALGTDVADPLERLARIVSGRSAPPDALARAMGERAPDSLTDRASAWLLSSGRRWLSQAAGRLGAWLPAAQALGVPTAQALVVPVPAPERALYLCGARLTYHSAMLPVRDGLGLSIAVSRHEGRVIVSPTACRELLPDPQRFALLLREAHQALLAAARSRQAQAQAQTGGARAPDREAPAELAEPPRAPARPRPGVHRSRKSAPGAGEDPQAAAPKAPSRQRAQARAPSRRQAEAPPPAAAQAPRPAPAVRSARPRASAAGRPRRPAPRA